MDKETIVILLNVLLCIIAYFATRTIERVEKTLIAQGRDFIGHLQDHAEGKFLCHARNRRSSDSNSSD